MSVNKYQKVSDSNVAVGDGASTVGIQEGMPRRDVNNAMRSMCSDIAKYADDNTYILTGGSADVLTVATSSEYVGYVDKMTLWVKFHVAPNADAAINVNNLGEKPIKVVISGSAVAIDESHINLGAIYKIIYDGDSFIVVGAGDVSDISSRALDFGGRIAENATSISNLPDGSIARMFGLSYKVNSAATGAESATNDLGVDGLIPYGQAVPGHFGAVGDGMADDTTALQSYIAHLKANELPWIGEAGANYLLTDASGLWLGSANTANTVRGFQANGSMVVIGVNGGVGVDLTGIQNGKRDEYDIRVDVSDGITAAHAVIQARPYRTATQVYSSGNAGKVKVWATGSYWGPAYYNVASESNVQQSSFLSNQTGIAAAWCRDDWFSGKAVATLTGAVAGAFTVGEIVTGGTSGATGVVLRADGARMFIDVTLGAFAAFEVLTGGTSGATGSTASEPFVFGVASPNTAIQDGEAPSTSTFQSIQDIWSNNGSSDKLWPTLLVRSFSSIVFQQPNVNSTDGGDLIEFHGDVSPMVNFGYLHAVHRYSLVFGDTADTTSQVVDRAKLVGLNAGSANTARLKCLTDLVRFENCRFDLDGDLDFGGADLNGDCRLDLGEHNLVASGRIEGVVTYDSQGGADLSGVTSGAADNLATLLDVSTGICSRRRELSQVINGGAIELAGPVVRVFGEGSAADDLTHVSLPSGVLAHGETFFLQLGSNAQPITVKPGSSGGNIRSRNNKRFFLNADILYPLIWDARQNEAMFIGTPDGDVAQTGFTPMTGTSRKGTVATSTVTLSQLAERVKALEAAMIASGTIST